MNDINILVISVISTLRSHLEKKNHLSSIPLSLRNIIISKYLIIYPYMLAVAKEINIYAFIDASIARVCGCLSFWICLGIFNYFATVDGNAAFNLALFCLMGNREFPCFSWKQGLTPGISLPSDAMQAKWKPDSCQCPGELFSAWQDISTVLHNRLVWGRIDALMSLGWLYTLWSYN